MAEVKTHSDGEVIVSYDGKRLMLSDDNGNATFPVLGIRRYTFASKHPEESLFCLEIVQKKQELPEESLLLSVTDLRAIATYCKLNNIEPYELS